MSTSGTKQSTVFKGDRAVPNQPHEPVPGASTESILAISNSQYSIGSQASRSHARSDGEGRWVARAEQGASGECPDNLNNVVARTSGRGNDVDVKATDLFVSEEQNGSWRNFDEFYAATYPRMLRLGVALVWSKAIAEDHVQDAYTNTYARFANLDDPVAYVRKLS